jgi:hypothetical protein
MPASARNFPVRPAFAPIFPFAQNLRASLAFDSIYRSYQIIPYLIVIQASYFV